MLTPNLCPAQRGALALGSRSRRFMWGGPDPFFLLQMSVRQLLLSAGLPRWRLQFAMFFFLAGMHSLSRCLQAPFLLVEKDCLSWAQAALFLSWSSFRNHTYAVCLEGTFSAVEVFRCLRLPTEPIGLATAMD